jgi:hypothetical protein
MYYNLSWIISSIFLLSPLLTAILIVELPYDPSILLLEIYPKECKSGYNKGICTPVFIAALLIIAKLWKQPRCPTTEEWIKQM